MAQNNDDNINYSFMMQQQQMLLSQPENPTVKEGTTFRNYPQQYSASLGKGRWNHVESSGSASGMEAAAFNLQNPYNNGFYDYNNNNYKYNMHEAAALHGRGIMNADQYTLLPCSSINPAGGFGESSSSAAPSSRGQGCSNNPYAYYMHQAAQDATSRIPQDFEFDRSWLNNRVERNASFGVQSLVSHMEALNMSSTNPYYGRFHGHHNNLEAPRSGHWLSLAKEPRGSRSLQKKIDEGTPIEICRILKELKYHLHDLMKNTFGHYVIEKFLQSTNISVAQKNAIIYLIIIDVRKLRDVCMDDQGNRVIQQIFENVKDPFMIHQIALAMWSITVPLMKNFNGGYVIQQCLKLFPPEYQNFILDVVAKNCVDIAKDRCGCCSIQKCMEYDELPAFLQLVNKLISNALVLAEDPYGNYVMQFLVKRKKIVEVNAMLISRLNHRYVRLSTNKYGSNVVEDLLQFSEIDDAAVIVQDLIESPDFLNVVQHPFGNYVVQRALQYTEGPLHERLSSMIIANERKLNSCLFGKMVLQYARAV